MLGHRSSSSASGLMMPFSESSPNLDLSWPPKQWASSSNLTLHTTSKQPRRTVSLRVFVCSLVCFSVVALALGLGLGLGCSSCRRTFASSTTTSPTTSRPLDGVTKAYSDVPADLDFIPIDQLINTRELELNTGFALEDKERIREFTFDMTLALAAPDGFTKPMALVNGQSPGPLIEARVGDTIRVTVNNRVANTSTAIHWHGIDQRRTTWMDGVAGVTQCGIPPGGSFTYEFRVLDQRGTFWWHAHLAVQYSDGAYGAIIVRDPEEMVPQTDDDKLVFVSDLYHTYGPVLRNSYLNATSQWVPFESGVEPLADNILLNGQNTYDCSVTSSTYPPSADQPFTTNCTGGQLYRTKVHQGKSVRLRLINASSLFSYWFSVDNHTLSIVELDGVEIEPIDARGVYLNLGQRVSVILTADQTPGSYYMRASLPKTCFLPYAPYNSSGLEAAEFGAKGILSYVEDSGDDEKGKEEDGGDDIGTLPEPIGVPGNTSNPYGVEDNGLRGDVWEGCNDMPFDMPVPMRRKPAVNVTEANTHYIEYAFRQAQDVNRIFINKTSYLPLSNNATLWKLPEQKFTPDRDNSYNSWDFGLNQQVLLVPDADQGAQIVINSRDAMEHPWHLHNPNPGHTFQVVGWGKGTFGTAETITTWNLENPMRRDTVTVPPYNHVVIRFATDNPGLWALHCHVAWHVEGGMFVTIAERPADLVELMDKMDPDMKRQSQSFCGAGGG